jgi:rod shape-determining protein MreC
MNWISNLFSRHWRNFHLITIALLSLLLIYGEADINGPVCNAAVSVFHYPFFKIKSSITALVLVHQENRRLHEALVETSVELSLLEEDRRENERLRAVLGFDPPPGYGLLPAKIVSVSGEKMPVSAVINKGEHDSVLVDQPVINEDGLIGRVVAVMSDFATVQLLTDPTSIVAARVTDSRAMGIVRYGLSEGMILDNLPVQGKVEVGDVVISSGLGGVYPAGLVVGTVKSVWRPEEEPFYRVRISPAAGFHSLDELFILKPRP